MYKNLTQGSELRNRILLPDRETVRFLRLCTVHNETPCISRSLLTYYAGQTERGIVLFYRMCSEYIQIINQGKALYDEDIILGITGGFRGNKEPGVTWFDLNKRTSPVLLPVEY